LKTGVFECAFKYLCDTTISIILYLFFIFPSKCRRSIFLGSWYRSIHRHWYCIRLVRLKKHRVRWSARNIDIDLFFVDYRSWKSQKLKCCDNRDREFVCVKYKWKYIQYSAYCNIAVKKKCIFSMGKSYLLLACHDHSPSSAHYDFYTQV